MSDRLAGTRPRLDAIDFWRGYLLCTIFINHIPGNAFEPLTQKNFGFSDSAEGFVFISGLALAMAYGRRFQTGDRGGATLALLRRALMLYGLHIFLSLTGVAIFVLGAAFGQGDSLLSVHGRDLAISAPIEMILGVFSLGHQFGYFNILPMYIMMLVIAPLLLMIAQVGRWPMLAASFALYVMATCGCNLPNWPESGSWFFDPFAWQFMVAIGITFGLGVPGSVIPRSVPLMVVAALIVVASAICVSDAITLWPGLEERVRGWGVFDKTTLGLGRLVHFLAIAYLIYGLRVAEWTRGSPAFGWLCSIGRHGLWMFCALSLMAAAGQVVDQYAGHTLLTDVAMISGGLCILAVLARRLDTRQNAKILLKVTSQTLCQLDRTANVRPAALSRRAASVRGETSSPVCVPR